jgi:hypothetical protein
MFDFIKKPAFGRRSQAVTPARPENGPAYPILVRESAYNSATPHDLVFEIVNFFRFATGTAQYERSELSPNALRSHYVTQYEGQVKNGGHGQYAGNSNGERVYLTSVQEGLEAMGHPLAATHRKMLDLAGSNPARMSEIANNGGFGNADPMEKTLDDEFFAGDRSTPIMVLHNAWLKTLPELRVVPDAEFKAAKERLAAANVAAAERARQRAAEQAAQDAKDPLKQALIYLCEKAPGGYVFERWIGGLPGMDIGDGIKVTRFVFVSNRGMCSALFHPKISSFYDDADKSKPVVMLATADVLKAVKKKTGQELDRMMELWNTGGPSTGRSSQ